ncbi:hypothetical protein [Algivirga pacifica]|uniref:DUF2326 domain-containing protein n=1 Tax=Algivirga pacifica TaxID=1162670 RepID=A0ABP9DML8_9BACT
MPAFHSVDQLLLELGNHKVRKVVDIIFKHNEVTLDRLIDLLEGDEKFVRSMLAKEIISTDDDEKVRMDERLLSFLEGFMEVREEIQNFEVDARIKGLRRRMRLYEMEDDYLEKQQHIDKIKSELKRIGKVIKRNVIDLSRLVMQDYKTADNAEVRKEKILDHNDKADRLLTLIQGLEEMLQEEHIFSSVQDEQLHRIANNLRHDYLKPARTNLIELSQEIVAFINRIIYHQRIFKKLMKIKRLRDHYELEKYTNIEEILEQDDKLFNDSRPSFRTKPSLEFLRSDDGYEMILKLATRQHHQSLKLLKAGEALDQSLINTAAVVEQRINYRSIKDKFLQSGKDLFTFIMEYPFKVETPFEERVKVYCKIALLYADELDYSEANDNRLQMNGYEFANIAAGTPKAKRQTKAVASV